MQNIQNYNNQGDPSKMEKELGVTQARQVFGTMVEQVQYQGDTYIISRHGKPAAAMVPMAVYEAWKRQRQELFDQIREMQREADLAPDEADRLAAEAVAAARA
jgi:prevent-host-death family protein